MLDLSFSNPFWPIALAVLMFLFAAFVGAILVMFYQFRAKSAGLPGFDPTSAMKAAAKTMILHAEDVARDGKAAELAKGVMDKLGLPSEKK